MLIPLGILDYPTGGGGAFDLLETQVLTSSASSVTFTGLGSYTDYKHLQIRAVTRSDRTGTGENLYLRLNADSGSNYAYHLLQGTGSSVGAAKGTSTDKISIATVGNTFDAGSYGVAVYDLLDFNSTSKNSTFRILSGYTGSINRVLLTSGLWNNTNAVTSLTFTVDLGTGFIAGSRFSLYGVK